MLVLCGCGVVGVLCLCLCVRSVCLCMDVFSVVGRNNMRWYHWGNVANLLLGRVRCLGVCMVVVMVVC